MQKKEIDQSVFLYNPEDERDIKRLIDKYPEFQLRIEGDSEQQRRKKKGIRYIIYMYDRNTPLRVKFPDIQKRKIEAAGLAGFKPNKNGYYEDFARQLMKWEREDYNRMIVKYVMLFGEADYLMLVRAWDVYANRMTREYGDGGNRKLNKTELQFLDQLKKIINETTNNLFGGRDSDEAYRVFIEEAELDLLRLRPEDYVEALDSGSETNNVL